jgi:hypothetical protein
MPPLPGHGKKPRKAAPKDAPATSTVPLLPAKRKNLTLHDWLTVFNYMDKHKDMSQNEVVEHFRTRREGALLFTQATLSRRLANREEMEKRSLETPSALSSKRPRAVTRPDIERYLVEWVKHMEKKGESVSGPMLRAKRQRYEDLCDVPESERLTGRGWVASFCRTYKLRERRRHGEAGSVDPLEVEVERERIRLVLAAYQPKDHWNIDESSLNPL